MSLLEWIAVGFGVVNIALLVRRSVWNYRFGMVMVALYVIVFKDARRYGEAGLQVFFRASLNQLNVRRHEPSERPHGRTFACSSPSSGA